MENMVQLVQVLLDHGADPNLLLDQKTTPAVFFGNREITALFIEYGARFDVMDNDRRSPLLEQAYRRNNASAILILEWEQRHVPDFCANFENRKDYLSAALARLLDDSYYHKIADTYILAERLLDGGADINHQTKDGKTALMEAKSEDMMRFLLERGANPNLQDNEGRTVLMKSWGEHELINLLFQAGADPTLKDNKGRTVLFHWMHYLDGPMLDDLISRGCLINEPDNEGYTPLIYAASSSGLRKVVLILLEKGADPNYRNAKGRTALHIFLLNIDSYVWYNDKEMKQDMPIITALLEAGTHPAVKDDEGDSALLTAMRISMKYNKPKPISELVQQYANAEDIKIAAAAERKKEKEYRQKKLSENLLPTIKLLSVPVVLGGVSYLMRNVVYKDNPSDNIMGPLNATLTLGLGCSALGFFMGGGDLGAMLVGGIIGGVVGGLLADLPSVKKAFTDNPALYYTPTSLSAVVVSFVIFDIWF
jgi:ankyrin repeat protein